MVRIAQYQVLDSTFGMAIAQRMVDGKVRNQLWRLGLARLLDTGHQKL